MSECAAKSAHPRKLPPALFDAMQHLSLLPVVFSHLITTILPLLPSDWTAPAAMLFSADARKGSCLKRSGGARFQRDPGGERRSIGVKKCSLQPPHHHHTVCTLLCGVIRLCGRQGRHHTCMLLPPHCVCRNNSRRQANTDWAVVEEVL